MYHPYINTFGLPVKKKYSFCPIIKTEFGHTFIVVVPIYEALQDTVYILLPRSWQNYCTTFCICWTPSLRLKMTATVPALRWWRLLVLGLWFSLWKYGVCPKKVGKMAFFGCSEFQWTKFIHKLLLELKTYWYKTKVFWNALAISFLMVNLKKKKFCTKNIVHGGTFVKSVSADQVSLKVSFFTVKCKVWHILD